MALLDLRGVINTFTRSGGVTISRGGAITYANGFPSDSTSSVPVIQAVVHPATAEDLKQFPEGVRANGAYVVYTKVALNGVLTPSGTRADRFTYNAKTYEVQASEWWENGKYWKSLAAEVKTA